ncbi:PqqD family protein [Kribbella sp. NPDC023972]|uniref:PqqD family protein n=1 Tax=Kribbella sp. NPDC023972 TaxID=3154795 RepID=UPI00340ACF0C
MSGSEDSPTRAGSACVVPAVDSTTSGVHVRAADVVLLGEMAGSGYRTPPALVRRADGQMIQLTRLLYLVLEAIDGHRDDAQIAELVSASYGRSVSAANVATLVEKLQALGLVRGADGSEPRVRRSNPLLGLRLRYTVTDSRRTLRITQPFARLFSPWLVVGFVAAFVYVCWWLLFDKGLASAAHDAFHTPGFLLLVFAVTVLSAGFHEFGHAAAARYGGSTPGAMGMGYYLFWPAFYTDVTDTYRLGRGGRIRTDLGGLYFNAIVAVVTVVVAQVTGYDALLLVVVTQILQMLRQLLPTIRFDGYHVLADLTGVPDLYHHIKPTLTGMLPWHWRDRDNRALKRWAQAVITVWCLTVVPLMLFVLAITVVMLPRVLATARASVEEQWRLLASGWYDADLVEVLARGLAILALALPLLGLGLLLWLLIGRMVRSVWRRTAGKPAQRSVAAVVALMIIAALGWAWWPDGDRYRPITPNERGTITDFVDRAEPATAQTPTSRRQLHEGDVNRTQVVWPAGVKRPTRQSPTLALVMVPRTADVARVVAPSTSSPTAVAPTAAATAAPPERPGAPVWVFPFDKPLPAGAGDNQALAVNTTDDTVVYDIAFALVWAEASSDPVTNTNEAYAFASCRHCAAVAIAFQVVMVIGDADIVVPQNLAGALNYECVQCLTYALATQLVVTLDGPLSADGMAALNRVWSQLADLARSIQQYPLSELRDRLTSFEQQILGVIAADGALTTPDRPQTATPTEQNPTEDGEKSPATEAPTPSSRPNEPPQVTPTSTPTPTPLLPPTSSTPASSPSDQTTSPATTPDPSIPPTTTETPTPTPTGSEPPTTTPTSP